MKPKMHQILIHIHLGKRFTRIMKMSEILRGSVVTDATVQSRPSKRKKRTNADVDAQGAIQVQPATFALRGTFDI